MPKWETTRRLVRPDPNLIDAVLGEMGSEEWEPWALRWADVVTIFFKRPVEEPEEVGDELA